MSRWPTKPLGELVDFVGGGTPRRDRPDYWGGEIPWASVKDLQSQSLETTLENITAEGLTNSSSNLIPKGTVIIASRVGLGKVAINQKPVAINQDLKALTPRSSDLSPRYLLLFLLSKAEYFARAGVGATVKGLTLADYQKLDIVLPPLTQQERIVKLLDEADELRKLRGQADDRTGDLIPALFYEMFGNSQFKPISVGELTSLVTSGATPRGGEKVYVSEGPYFIRSQNVQMNRLDFSNAVCLPAEVHEQMSRTKVASGDVLLNITGASIGRVAWVDRLDREANVSQHVCLIRPRPELLNAAYLSVFISLPSTQRFMLQVQAGASRQALNHQQVRALEISLPPLSLQKEFATRVSEIRTLQAEQAASRHCLDNLFQSMLQRAFNGEL